MRPGVETSIAEVPNLVSVESVNTALHKAPNRTEKNETLLSLPEICCTWVGLDKVCDSSQLYGCVDNIYGQVKKSNQWCFRHWLC